MKKVLVICVLLSISSAQALDVDSYIKKIKSQVNRLMGNEPKVAESKIKLPAIPKSSENALSVEVYDKSGKLHTQGKSFNKLKLEDKRKYRIAFLQELYFVTRDSEAKPNEIIKNLNMLEQGGTREGIYRSLVLDGVYGTLEAYEDIPSDELVSFVISFSEKYLNSFYASESIKQLNLWGIKRVIVEKTLEVMDSFKSDGANYYKWYAVLSEELSRKRESIWQSMARKNKDIMFHYKWVQSVPFQHSKSEVIIKLHKLMNKLNTIPNK